MKVKFYGTRGSLPICDPNFQEFGGNTTCVAVFGDKEEDDILVFDAGTGIRKLGKELMNKDFVPDQKILLLFTHFHWDHIQGFPFFDPAYDKKKHIRILSFGENFPVEELQSILGTQMGDTYFPVSLENMGSKVTFGTGGMKESEFDRGKLAINHHSHPGGAIDYRLEIDGKSMHFCTDMEHGDQLDPNIIAMAKDVDLLIHEAQYTPEELQKFKGWGHSSWEQAIEVAERAGVRALYLTHHDPDHDDDFLLEMEHECQKRFPNCFVAREGQEIIL